MDPVIIILDISLHVPFRLKRYAYTIEDVPKKSNTVVYDQVFTDAIPSYAKIFIGCVFKIRPDTSMMRFEHRVFAGCYFDSGEEPKFVSCKLIFCNINHVAQLYSTDLVGAPDHLYNIYGDGCSCFGVKIQGGVDGYFLNENDIFDSGYASKIFRYLGDNCFICGSEYKYTTSMIHQLDGFIQIRCMSEKYLEKKNSKHKKAIAELDVEKDRILTRILEINEMKNQLENNIKMNRHEHITSVYGFAMKKKKRSRDHPCIFLVLSFLKSALSNFFLKS